MTENQQIAETIIAQLGGKTRLVVFTGATDFVAIDRGVQFKIGRNEAGINKVIIKLNGSDLYNVEFGTSRLNSKTYEYTWTVKDSTEDAYADMLKPLFERATGMYLSM